MKNQLKRVQEFHHAFDLPVRHSFTPLLSEQEVQLRYDLMCEENKEYLDACKSGNKMAVADALGDMLYVLMGTVISHGLQDHLEAVFEEIHRSNMSKLDEQGLPIHRKDGKIIKSTQYSPPQLGPILKLNSE